MTAVDVDLESRASVASVVVFRPQRLAESFTSFERVFVWFMVSMLLLLSVSASWPPLSVARLLTACSLGYMGIFARALHAIWHLDPESW
jgi:hypothetical protein